MDENYLKYNYFHPNNLHINFFLKTQFLQVILKYLLFAHPLWFEDNRKKSNTEI